jgi:hypothetical protein
MNKNKLFQTKILFLYDFYCENNIDKLTKLFYIKNKKTTFNNRKLYIQQNWLKKELSPSRFSVEYRSYPFYKFTISGQRLFMDANEFLGIKIEEFRDRIRAYRSSLIKIESRVNTKYQYIYLFSKHIKEGSHNIDYYEIEYLKNKDDLYSIDIKVFAPKNRRFKIEPYFGSYREENHKIIIDINNSNNHFHAIFNSDISKQGVDYLVGVVVGIADSNEKNPIAKKVLLSKKKIENLDSLYFMLNETEQILADEYTFGLSYFGNEKYAYLKKYFKGISSFTKLLKRVSNDEFYNDFYHQLGFNGLYQTNKVFSKIKNSGSYFAHSREDIIKTLLNSYKTEGYQKLFIVMPTYEEDNLFEHFSEKVKNIQNELIILSSRISINIIFVLHDCKEALSTEFIQIIEKLSRTITINLISKTSIVQEVNSIDFIFTNRQNFLVIKYLRQENPPFYICKDKHIIIQHQNSFYKIKRRAISYQEFKENQKQLCHNFDPIINRIKGEWFHYFYGSQTHNKELKFWKNKILIHLDKSVEYFSNAINKTDDGEVMFLGKQILLTFVDIDTENSSIILFEQEDIIEKAFVVKMIDKQYRNNLDMFTIGIFAKIELKEAEAKKILGDIQGVRVIENRAVRRRVSEFLIESEGYYN